MTITIIILVLFLLLVDLFIGLKVLSLNKKEIKENEEYIKRVENTVLHYQKNVNNTLTETLRQKKKVDYISDVSSRMDKYVSNVSRKKQIRVKGYRRKGYRRYIKQNRIRTAHLGHSKSIKVGFRLNK